MKVRYNNAEHEVVSEVKDNMVYIREIGSKTIRFVDVNKIDCIECDSITNSNNGNEEEN